MPLRLDAAGVMTRGMAHDDTTPKALPTHGFIPWAVDPKRCNNCGRVASVHPQRWYMLLVDDNQGNEIDGGTINCNYAEAVAATMAHAAEGYRAYAYVQLAHSGEVMTGWDPALYYDGTTATPAQREAWAAKARKAYATIDSLANENVGPSEVRWAIAGGIAWDVTLDQPQRLTDEQAVLAAAEEAAL